MLTVAFMLAAPVGARSLPLVSKIAQCHGIATVNAAASRCTAQFLLTDSRFPSDIESHANFHALMAQGKVTIEWRDQLFALQARFVCESPGLYASAGVGGNGVGGGPADLSTYPNCTREISQSAYFAVGVQTLVVTAEPRACHANDGSRSKCPFHGYLVLNPEGFPL